MSKPKITIKKSDSGKSLVGMVTRIVSNRYNVDCDGKTYIAYPRGHLKLKGDIFVGDMVEFSDSKPFASIDNVLERKNCLQRPYVSNVDVVIIVVAPEPEVDLLLVDKIILNCFVEGIKPIICYNKMDIDDGGQFESIKKTYEDICTCIKVSSFDGDSLDVLNENIDGKFACFAGQSAVGKTSLLNALTEKNLPIGELSKIKRGKNTTRHVEVYDVGNGKIADTCGFSVLELPDLQPENLKYYYEEYLKVQNECKISKCLHIQEGECAVKSAVEHGKLDKGRYERYVAIYKELCERRQRKYGQNIDFTIHPVG